ncbi:MAG: GAF domain-containing protein [Deltaproteobacteria bacterium]|nr:GAF domain-containing protein [Deltaproteobacteria bacterium]
MQEDKNLSLVKMISTNGIEEQCSNISNWLKQQYPLDGIGFFLKEAESTQAHFFTQTVSKDVVHKLEDMLLKINQTEEAQKDVLFFAQKKENFVTFSPGEHSGSLEPMGLTIPLGVLGHSVGTLALIADPATLQDVSTQTYDKLSFIPIISGLLDNAMSHELKNNKIRMLNLYQTVSSSLSYIGDLQELLTTIISIVTSELLCEECSVLLYDQENNEFEFFTAVGETGMELVKERFPADKGIAGRALREKATQVVNDVQSDPDFYGNIDKEHAFKTKSILAAPLMSGDELVGVINALNKVENKFFDKEDDQKWLWPSKMQDCSSLWLKVTVKSSRGQIAVKAANDRLNRGRLVSGS